MAIVIEAVGTIASATVTNTVEVDVPAHDAGDLLVVIACVSDDNLTLRVNETGFDGAFRVNSSNASGVDSGGMLDAKISSGSEPSALTVQIDSGSLTLRAAVLVLSGVHADIFDALPVIDTGAADQTAWDPSAIVTSSSNALVCSLLHKESATTAGVTPPSGYTMHVSPDGNSVRMGFASIIKAASGSEDPGVWDGFVGTEDIGGFTVAFKPVAGLVLVPNTAGMSV